MTGIEPAAIAGAVGKVAKKAVDKAIDAAAKENETLLTIAEKSGELDPAALVRAKRALVTQQIFLKILQPLGMLFGAPREYFNTDFNIDMAERLADVPQEEIVTPPFTVAGPAMLGLGFSLDEPQLKAMYLNLLVAASDRRTQDSAHPGFAEIIKQISASEAEALAAVLKLQMLPVVEIRALAVGSNDPVNPPLLQSYSVIAMHVLDWRLDGKQVPAPERAVHVDNWLRLGLVTVDYMQNLTDDERYSWVETNPLMATAREQYDTSDTKRVIFQKGILRATEFGRSFERVVISSDQKALTAAQPTDPADNEDTLP